MASSDLGRQAVDRLLGGHLDQWLRDRQHLSHNQLTDELNNVRATDGAPIGLRFHRNTVRRWRIQAQHPSSTSKEPAWTTSSRS